LQEFSKLKELDTLELSVCKIKSLSGCEELKKLQCLYLPYNRSLSDISSLKEVKNSLKALRIDTCSRIKDFSVLRELENLQLLELCGSNEVPDIYFIKKMKYLKTFVFNVLNGDLKPCLDLQYVAIERCRRHYNVKEKDLPQGEYVRGNEDIELWRRFE